MYGAILGDMIGSPYEFDAGGKTKDFPLFIPSSKFTDDSSLKHLRDGPGHSKAGHPESWPKASLKSKQEQPEEMYLPQL